MKVLVGVTGSEESDRTLAETIDRALAAGDDVTVAVLGAATDDPGRVREESVDQLETAGLDPDVRVLEGHPGSGLVTLAEREDFDSIVIGGGTESPMGKINLGSITEFVLLNAQTTVVLVR